MSPSQKMKKLVVVDDGISTIKVDGLEPFARTLADEFVIHRDAPADNEALIQRCQGADAVINILSTSEFTRDLMTRCPDLRVVSIWAAGVNNVDLDAAKELGVTICNTPGLRQLRRGRAHPGLNAGRCPQHEPGRQADPPRRVGQRTPGAAVRQDPRGPGRRAHSSTGHGAGPGSSAWTSSPGR